MMEWHLVESGFQRGEVNMQYDVELARRLHHGEILPTLRLYGWKPWAVSLGYNQSAADVDEHVCAEREIDIVRRPTGGRAILHANEVTYSVVMFAEGKGITEIYSAISRALVEGLSQICPSVEYEMSQPNLRQLYRQQESIPCFSSSARYEVQIGGKKLVGSAQRRLSFREGNEVVLQHGSILLGPEHKLLGDIVKTNSADVAKKIREDLDQKTTDLSAALGRSVSYHEVSEAVKKGFERSMHIHFTSIQEAVQ